MMSTKSVMTLMSDFTFAISSFSLMGFLGLGGSKASLPSSRATISL